MSTTRFRILEHTLPASYIREYPRATAGEQEDELRVAIKQYTPLRDASNHGTAITVIGAHANGFPKELYEPLWDELFDRLGAKNIHISSIWIADCSHQGDSGVLNETKMGNDPSWMDYPRDMFLMINHFRKHMKRPLVGIGHSMGGCALINLALMHPRLLTTLILMDPVVQRFPDAGGNFIPAKASTARRDRWPSRREAEAAFKRSKFYSTWDPRVLDKWIEYGLRELPTFIHPELSSSNTLPVVSADHSTATVQPARNLEREVTLKTTKHQEVFTFIRAIFPTPEFPSPSTDPNPITHPDIDTRVLPVSPFYRAEPLTTFSNLPYVRPSIFYIFGDQSHLSAPHHVIDKLALTGIGVGGSGGVAKDRVKSHTFHGVGHLIPMEIVNETANASSSWLVPEVRRWKEIEDKEKAEWASVPHRDKGKLGVDFVKNMNGSWIEDSIKELAGRMAKL